jgi:hypothetical protein
MEDYSWDLDKKDPMVIVIFCNGKRVMSLFLGEAMESAGREEIMKHVAEIENSPWIRTWHKVTP